MKLYYAPGACSLAAHIILQELGVSFTPELVDLKTKTYSGGDFNRINPKSQVPTLGLEDRRVLTENVAILEYLADLKPEAKLLPKAGSFDRYRGIEWLAFISTEIHKGFGTLFKGSSRPEDKEVAKTRLVQRFGIADQALKGHPFLLGTQFSVADAYLYVMMTWASRVDLDLSRYPDLVKFAAEVKHRPSVQAALKAESAGH